MIIGCVTNKLVLKYRVNKKKTDFELKQMRKQMSIFDARFIIKSKQ